MRVSGPCIISTVGAALRTLLAAHRGSTVGSVCECVRVCACACACVCVHIDVCVTVPALRDDSTRGGKGDGCVKAASFHQPYTSNTRTTPSSEPSTSICLFPTWDMRQW